MIDEPVTVTYTHPRERVLFNAARDANPFFHLYESLWMLAGRNDVESLAYYAKQMREYSDDGVTLNGAYGYRWRHRRHFKGGLKYEGTPIDQLDVIVSHLKTDPHSRRAVLQMWNVEDDLLKIGPRDTGEVADGFRASDKPGFHPVVVPASKDVCCLAGETRFRSPEGDTDIATLAGRFNTDPGYRYPVYTIDTVTGDQRLSWMTAAWKTGIRKTIVLRLDDGSSIRLTTNHVVFRKRKTFDGKRCSGISVSECEAGDLRVGDSLLAELPESSGCRINQGYRQFKRNVFLNTSGRNMVKEHREYYEFVTGDRLGTDEVHHLDENRLNNRFDNLEAMDEVTHQRLHKTGSNNPHCKMSDQDKARRGRIHSAVLRSGGKGNTPQDIRDILAVRPSARTDAQNNVLWDWVCSLSNHKVVSIEDGGYTTVYDFTVPGRHNAVLSNGVLVHNCNLSVMFSLREEMTPDGRRVERAYDTGRERTDSAGLPAPEYEFRTARLLDMTVTNRSNDLIWGMLGANHVHFTFLQEYLAARLGAEVGRYHHFTNNLHVYDWNWKPEEWLNAYDREQFDPYQEGKYYGRQEGIPVSLNQINKTIPLVKDHEAFERELPLFVETYSGEDPNRKTFTNYTEPFLRYVAEPAMLAFCSYKRRHWDPDLKVALGTCEAIKADDWRLACTNWLKRRIK